MFGGLKTEKTRPMLRQLVLSQCQSWYAYAPQALADLPPERYITVCYPSLTQNPAKTLQRIYQHFGWQMRDAMQEALSGIGQQHHRPRRSYTYSIEEAGVSLEEIKYTFAPLVEAAGCSNQD
jgi:hypothetical protein